ncbi:MAG: PilZ domain-containing protein [Desulfobulbaceae bacterium]|nr:PilZ domain-containing protein [Desulfobulbaceae bacterium]
MARNVLIFDESFMQRRIIQSMILANLDDINVFQAKDAEDFEEQLERETLQLVFFNWYVAKMDWNAFFEGKKNKSAGRTIPFVLLAANDEKKLILEAQGAGVKDFLDIPCSPESFADTINLLCNPVNMRKTKRYSLPATTAVFQQDSEKFDAAIINISQGGILCEMEYSEKFNLNKTVMIAVTVSIGEKEVVLNGLIATFTSITVIEKNPDFTQKKIRIAFRFLIVPPDTQPYMDTVLEYAEGLESSM